MLVLLFEVAMLVLLLNVTTQLLVVVVALLQATVAWIGVVMMRLGGEEMGMGGTRGSLRGVAGWVLEVRMMMGLGGTGPSRKDSSFSLLMLTKSTLLLCCSKWEIWCSREASVLLSSSLLPSSNLQECTPPSVVTPPPFSKAPPTPSSPKGSSVRWRMVMGRWLVA